nr:TraB/GumN family protein [Hyphomonas sp. Mor2]
MKKLRTGLGFSLLSLALVLTACGRSTTDDSTDTATSEAVESASESIVERPTKEMLRAEFDAAMETARETNGPGAPVMWRLADEDTVIHIFGTVHLLRPELEWRTEAFNTALTEADTVVFEVDMKSPEAQRAIATDFLARGMFQDGRTLRQVLGDEDEAVVSAAFDSVGVPMDAMNAFEPWMASVNLGVMKLMADGYDPNSGVETVIESEATEAGKSFGFLESVSQQADAFDLLDEEDQISMLYESALMLDETPQMLDLLVDEWADGDIAGMEALVANPEGVGINDAFYESLLVNRNRNWVPQIEAMLEEPGSVLIAVGAGHLSGPDSVIKMLRDKGYEIEGP